MQLGFCYMKYVLNMSIRKYNQYVMKKATRVLKINKQGEFLDVSSMCEMFSLNLFLKIYYYIIFPLFLFSTILN